TPIPACLWFLAREKASAKFRNRRQQTLFIDARTLGHLTDRTHRDFSNADIARITRTYHAWRGEEDAGTYEDVPGFCADASLEEITEHNYALTPGRYVGATVLDEDGDDFEVKMATLTDILATQFAESHRLESLILSSLEGLKLVDR
ncbi:MAG: SAM-dependent methyltransferase, partial [Chloroflexota bacterium]|nr:SAM-dependent methyltransferase [Chloroflexota bacterium]